MSTTLFLVQILTGLQLGVLLFLVAAGLTLVFGVMNFINLAHGVQYMLGAYLAVAFYGLVGNFFFALVLALAASLLFGPAAGISGFPPPLRPRSPRSGDRHVRHHPVSQSRGAGGVGAAPLTLPVPEFFTGSIVLMSGLLYPVWRLVVIASGACDRRRPVRIGDLHPHRHAGARRRHQCADGVGARRQYRAAVQDRVRLRHDARAGFAGIMIAPIISVEPGMGDNILILAFVVIEIGGIGSIRGAFIAALLIGLVDTLGRSFSVDILRLMMGPSPARMAGPAIASMLIYVLMAVVLYVRPAGLFPARGALT